MIWDHEEIDRGSKTIYVLKKDNIAIGQIEVTDEEEAIAILELIKALNKITNARRNREEKTRAHTKD